MREVGRRLLTACCLLLATAGLLSAATVKLFLKDGTYQVAREYKVEGDRVQYLSADRGEWEEIPLSLVDLEKTRAVIKRHEEEAREEECKEGLKIKDERPSRGIGVPRDRRTSVARTRRAATSSRSV